MAGTRENRQRLLVFPREHGAWGMLLVPLATGSAVGLFAGGKILPLVPLILATLALFWLRTPVESWLGTTPLRSQSDSEKRLVRGTALALAGVSVFALSWVFWGGRNRDLEWIGACAALAVLAQTYLKNRWRRARVAAQMIGVVGLSSAAPAAYYVATSHWTALAGSLWITNWLFAANQIHFVQLRIHGSRTMSRTEKLSRGRGFVAGQIMLIAVVAVACGSGFFKWRAALAFVPALVRGFAWFIAKPQPLAIRTLGFTELAHAAVFGVLLIIGLSAW